MGTTLAMTTTRNDDVHTINNAIQADRLERNDLDSTTMAPLSIGIGHPGDVITTRRNDRRLITTNGDTVRNRDRWTINTIRPDGALGVTSLDGNRTVTLPADYVTEHVHLGYAATEHGAQGETADASLTIVTDATTNRGLYVGATRGRKTNVILTVADDRDHAIERLTHIITNDRTDLPATAQRRHLLNEQKQVQPEITPRCPIPIWFPAVRAKAIDEAQRLQVAVEKRDAERAARASAVAHARRQLPAATATHRPFAEQLRKAKADAYRAQQAVWSAEGDLRQASRLRRRAARQHLDESAAVLVEAETLRERLLERARPTKEHLDQLEAIVDNADDDLSIRSYLDGYRNLDGRFRAADSRLRALDTWHRWALGHEVIDAALTDAANALVHGSADEQRLADTLGINGDAVIDPASAETPSIDV